MCRDAEQFEGEHFALVRSLRPEYIGRIGMRRSGQLLVVLAGCIGWPSPGAERAVIDRLLGLAASQPTSDAFRSELNAAMGPENIRKGTAIVGNGPDFVWAVESARAPVLYVDDENTR